MNLLIIFYMIAGGGGMRIRTSDLFFIRRGS